MFHQIGLHSFLPPRSPNRWVTDDRTAPTAWSSDLIASCRIPPSARGDRFVETDLDLDSEELIEGGKELLGAQSTLLDVNDGSGLVVEHGHR